MSLTTNDLKIIANKIRYYALDGIFHAQSGHPGGSLSMAEIMAVLYFHEMRVDPQNPKDPDRDRFVLSKGHAAPGYYAALALKGFFPVKQIGNLRKIDCVLQGHPDMKKISGVDMSTGSLGQGISAATGMALYGKTNKKDYRVYALTGDGELQEGQVWEAAMAAGHYKLANLTVFVDNNNLQIDGEVTKVMSVYPIAEKFEAFGFAVQKINGNDIEEVIAAIDKCKLQQDKPNAIICSTVKGKGVSFMENQAKWHGAAPDEELYKKAAEELETAIIELGGAL
ncbi:MAG: transketolase [Clostridiales bacterium]|nr:transketolase [Clostridiales bacterium]